MKPSSRSGSGSGTGTPEEIGDGGGGNKSLQSVASNASVNCSQEYIIDKKRIVSQWLSVLLLIYEDW